MSVLNPVAKIRRGSGSGRTWNRALAWPATLAIVIAFVLAPTPATADETPVAEDPIGAVEPQEDPVPPPPPVEEAPAESTPPVEAPADSPPSVDEEIPPPEEPAAETTPTVEEVENEVLGSEAAGQAAVSAVATESAPVTPTFVQEDLAIGLSPASVLPGEDFSFTLTGCPFISNPGFLQGPYLAVFEPDLVTNVAFGDDVLGGIYTGFSSTSSDPWVFTGTVALDAPPGGYRISPRCQTRESVDDDFTYAVGPFETLTVLDPSIPTATISPATGQAGDQFTANIHNCPDSLGPNGYAITQITANHSGPTPFLTAFSFVSSSHTGEPKPYVWEVTDDAAPGVYTLVFSCYTQAGELLPENVNPVTFTVEEPDDPFVFDGVATIDPATGHAGDEFTITGTGCPDGEFQVGIGDPPGFLATEDFTLIEHNALSGDDPMYYTLTLNESAAPGIYTWLGTCVIGQEEYDYEPLVYTLLERETTPDLEPTPKQTEPVADDVDDDSSDVVAVSSQVLPDAGSPTSPNSLFAAFLALMAGLLMVVAGRRRA